jgi:hypothetical protein
MRLAQVQARRADVAALLEERDARLGPEPRPKSTGELVPDGEHRRQEQLREVVEVREALGLGELQVHLEARVAGLDHHRVVFDHELVDAADGEVEGLAARAFMARLIA